MCVAGVLCLERFFRFGLKGLFGVLLSGGCFGEDTRIINVGIGLGGMHYVTLSNSAGYYSGRTPTFNFSYEQALKQHLGIGYLGVGAYLGFQSQHDGFDRLYHQGLPYYYEHRRNYFMIASRAAYHFDVVNSEKAELYAGAIVGVNVSTYSYRSNHPDPKQNEAHKQKNSFSVYPAYSVFAGARWYFSDNVGLFGEVGYRISSVTGGFSFKF